MKQRVRPSLRVDRRRSTGFRFDQGAATVAVIDDVAVVLASFSQLLLDWNSCLHACTPTTALLVPPLVERMESMEVAKGGKVSGGRAHNNGSVMVELLPGTG
jgi:hypothetical protein